MIILTRLFKSNQSQAVRLPKLVAMPSTVREVEIIVLGNSRLISPAGESWASWFSEPAATMPDRDQPLEQEREILR